MKKTLKKSLSWLLVLATLFSLCAAMSVGISAAPVSLGKAGDNIEAWYNSDTQTLSLVGSGPMYDYVEDGEIALSKMKDRPWEKYIGKIKVVTMTDGITTVGNAAFYNVLYLASCSFSNTLQTIGEWAFGRTAITSVSIPASTRLIKHFAFNSSGLLRDNSKNSICWGTPTIENEHFTTTQNGDVTSGTQTNYELVNDLNRTSSGAFVIEASGTVPSGIKWKYSTATKHLELFHDGSDVATMAELQSVRPWDLYMDDIQTLTIGDNIGNIGAYAFVSASNLRSVTLGKDVAKIGSYAFAGCSALTSLSLPLATKTIEDEAFSSRSASVITITTPNKKAVMDPGNACANDDYIVWNYGSTTTPTPSQGQNSGVLSTGITWTYANGVLVLTAPQANLMIPAFSSAANTPWAQAGLSASIRTVVIGQNIWMIGSYAFANLTSLVNVTMGANVSYISSYAFSGTTSLRTIDFPGSVAYIEANAFTGSGLMYATKQNTSMIFGTPNTELSNALNNGSSGSQGTQNSGIIPGTTLFWSYDPITRCLTIDGSGGIPDYEYSILTPWGSAGLSSQIASLVIGANVTQIGKNAFENCTALSSVTLGTGVQLIGQRAFANTTALRSIALPSSVLIVNSYAFVGSGLTSATQGNPSMIIKENNTELTAALNQQQAPTNPTGTIPGTSLTWTYYSALWSLSISGTGAIPNYTTYGQTPWAQAGLNQQVKALYISTGITDIGDYAFANMPLLSEVALGADINTIGQYAFAADTLLKAITLPASVTTVKEYAFNGCISLNSATAANASITIKDPNTELKNALNKQPGGTGTPPAAGVDAMATFGPNNALTWRYTASDRCLVIYPTSSTTTNISIPDYTATTPAPWAYLNGSIASVVISSNITGIGNYAFANMPYLQSVTIGEGVSIIGNYAFLNANRLNSIVFPVSVTLVKANAFTGCSGLSSAIKMNANMQVMPTNTELLRVLSTSTTPSTPGTPGSTVTEMIAGTNLIWTYDATTGALNITGNGAIPNYATAELAPWSNYAPLIKAITVQTGVTAIGDHAFAGIGQVVDLYLPDSVTAIGNEAFYGCVALRTIRLPETLVLLGNGAFRSCSSLTTIDIPDRVTAINDYTFRDCISLESVELPGNLLTIGAEAFYGCARLKSVTLPAGLYTVGLRAFYGCAGLESVIFRGSNTSVSMNAFEGCTALQKAVYEVNVPKVETTGNELLIKKLIKRYNSGNGWSSDRAEGTLTITGTGEITNSAAWREELQYTSTLVFSQGITGIGANLLKDNRNVTRVQMADSVTTIGAGAFENCASLEIITFSNALHTMGARAFYGCTALTSIRLPDSLKVIPESAFAGCSSLENVEMGKELMMIGANAFAKCGKLDNVVLPLSLRSIAAGAFNDCRELTKLELYGGNLNQLAGEIFDNCVKLTSVGFHGTKTEWDALTANADPELKAANVTYYVKLTVHHVYKGGPKDGQTVAASEVLSGKKDDVLTITAKTNLEHYEADEFDATFTLGADNSEITITYSPKTYTLKIECVDAKTGTLLGTLPDQKVKYGDAFKASAGPIEGYTAEDSAIVVESMTGDMTYTVKYNKNVYTYTVEYFNTKTQKVFDSKEYQAEHGTAITAETPELTGYTLISGSYKIDELTRDGEKITVKYEPSQKMLTIVYVDTEGNKLSEDVTVSVYYGAEVMIASPMVTGKVADQEIVSLESYNGEEKITVTYDWRYYTVTVRFIEKDSYGYQIRPDYVKLVKHGDPFTFAMDDSYNEAAYVTDKSAVTYAAVTADITETVTYSPKPLKLTIEYVKADGKKIGTVEQTVYAGKSYTVEPHEFKKYLQTEEPVTGTMGVEDETITITLEKDPAARSAGKVILVIFIILLVLGTGGALFYFLYLKKKPY